MSTPLQRAALRRKKALSALLVAQRNLQHREYELAMLLTPIYPVPRRFFSFSTCHKCEKSPVGTCLYDDLHDEAHDRCLACGNPEERK